MSAAAFRVAGAVFALHVLLAASGLTWHDGGELVLAARSLGVAHPPGEPAYLVLAALAARLPVGDAAFRLTLLSAATTAAAAGLLTEGVRRAAIGLGGSEAGTAGWAGGAAGATFGLSAAVVLQGARPELYGLAALLGVAAALAIQSGGRRGLALAVVPLCVAGAVHHAMLVAAVPGLALFAWGRGRGSLRAAVGAAALLLGPGLGQFLWLPMRSFANPPLDFGSPRSLERVLWAVSGAGYGRSFRVTTEAVLDNLRAHMDLLASDLGVLALALAAVGAARLSRAGRGGQRALGSGLLLAGFGLAPTVLQGVFRADNPDASGYLLGVYAVLAAGAGLGVELLIGVGRARFGDGRLAAGLAGLLFTALLAAPLSGTAARAVQSGVAVPALLGDAVLDEAAPGSLLALSGDSWVFPALLARYDEGRRPDVHVVGLHLLDPAALPGLAARGLPVPPALPPAVEAALADRETCCRPEELLRRLARVGVALAVNEAFLPPDLALRRRATGLLYRLDSGPEHLDGAEDRVDAALLGPARALGADRDPVAQETLSRRAIARAGHARLRGDERAALRVLVAASAAEPDPWSLVHLHRHRLETGAAPRVALAPGPWTAPLVAGDDPAAREALDAALSGVAAPDADLLALRGTLLLLLDRPDAAAHDISRVLALVPDHPLALPTAERLYTVGRHAAAPVEAGP